MKARKIAILLFIFTSAIVNPAYMVDNIQEDPSMIDTPYEFPVVPGTDDWAELDSLEEKLEVSQIPDDLLEKLTTEALVQTVIDYPLAASLFVHDTLDDPLRSYYVVVEEFNGLAELDRRLKENPEEVANALNNVMADMYTVQSKSTDDFELMCINKLATVLSGIEPIVAKSVIEKELPTGDPDISVSAYYNLSWSDHGTTASSAATLTRRLLEEYPSATLIRKEVPQYNCHSYAWYSTSSSNKYWINDPSNYYNAGDYSKATTPKKVTMLTEGNTGSVDRVESKWGASALFEHDYDDCPYSARTLEYYR